MIWIQIDEFPGYSVSNEGLVRNDRTEYLLTPTRNQSGLVMVGLMKDGDQHKRGVAKLVAETFLDPPKLIAFDTPINLNGDRFDNRVDNLAWRPKWFAVMYFQQFNNGKRGFDKPIQDIKTGETFPTSWEAAIKYGLLDREIMIATLNRTYVWPTFQEFRLIE